MSFGEYKQMTQRVIARWKRREYDAALAEAERTYELETGELVTHGHSHAAWGLISVYTGLKRHDDARRIFAAVVADKTLFAARIKQDAVTLEKALMAGACIAWESGDFAAQAKTMQRAFDLRSPAGAELAFAYACFFARTGDKQRAWKALDVTIGKGTAAMKVLTEADLLALHGDRRWDDIVAKVLPWKIESQPPGAKIFLDDVDTGVVTPGRVKPTRETHRVKLTLDGYADDEVEITAKSQLSMDRHLTSLAAIAERQRMIDDAAREPDDPARAKTRAFIGEPRRGRIRFTRHATYGLGGLSIEVYGDGRIRLDHGIFMPTDQPMELEVKAEIAEVAALFEQFIEAAFTELVIANLPGVADELYLELVLVGRGGRCKHAKFASHPHPRFNRLVDAVLQLALRAVDPSLHRALTLG